MTTLVTKIVGPEVTPSSLILKGLSPSPASGTTVTDAGDKCFPTAITIQAVLGGVLTDLSAYYFGPASVSISGGINGYTEFDLIARPMAASFVLNNYGGIFYTEGGSALAGWGKGVKVYVKITYDGYQSTQFVGWVTDCKPDVEISANGDKVRVTAQSWLGQFGQTPIVSPAIDRDKTSDLAAQEIIAITPTAPEATAFSVGDTTFPTVFDTTTNITTVLAELSKIAYSEWGPLYERRDGTLVLESGSQRGASAEVAKVPVLVADADYMMWEDGDYMVWEDDDYMVWDDVATLGEMTSGYVDPEIKDGANIINRAMVKAHPRRVDDTPALLASTTDALAIPAGGSITQRLKYFDQTGRAKQVAALTDEMETPIPGTTVDSTLKALLNFQTDATDSTSLRTWTLGELASDMIDNVYYQDGYYVTWAKAIIGGFLTCGGYSAYKVTTPTSADFDFGSGDFAIDWWESRYDVASGDASITRDVSSAYPPWLMGYSDGTNLYAKFSFNGSSFGLSLDMGRIATEWVNFRVCRHGNWWYAFSNGVETDRQYNTGTLPASTGTVAIGLWNTSVYAYFSMDALRIYKGNAISTQPFTPEKVEPSIYLQEHYWGNTAQDRSQTDITSDIVITPTFGTEAATAVITNNNASAGFVKLDIYGKGVYFDAPIDDAAENSASISAYGYREKSINQKYQHDLTAGMAKATTIVSNRATSRTDLLSVKFIGNRSSYLMRAALYCQTGSLVRIALARAGVSGYYYIQGWNISIRPGKIVECEWTLCQDFTH
jgi:hypothetical protein